MKNRVNVLSFDKRFSRLTGGIEDAAYFFLEELHEESVSLNVYLIGTVKMRELNNVHRGKDKSTDVLSFGLPKGFPDAGSNFREIGEIYLCPPFINSEKEDIRYFLLHGMLHLLGFNHENKSDRIKMESLENELMQWLNKKS